MDQPIDHDEKPNLLFDAIFAGKMEKVQKLLSRDPELYNCMNINGETPITYAFNRNQPEIAKYLEECVSAPKIKMDDVCSSSYSWIDLEKDYFTLHHKFRNYYLANMYDKWGRNALPILFSYISIILSIPTNIPDVKSPEYSDKIERAANEWKKVEIFQKHGIKLNHLDFEGKHPLVSFFKSLSKLIDDNVFGYDYETKQDKAKHLRNYLAHFLKLILNILDTSSWQIHDWRAIVRQYHSCKYKGGDMLKLLTKSYPELGALLPDLVNFLEDESKIVPVPKICDSEVQNKNESIRMDKNFTFVDLEQKIWNSLKHNINVVCGCISDVNLLMDCLERYLVHSGKILSSDLQKILNKEEIVGADAIILHNLNLDLQDIIKLKDNLINHYSLMKIILVTNRSDIINVFSSNHAFFFRKQVDGWYELNHCHPTLAKLRLTKGARNFDEIVGSHIDVKVYVSSKDDLKMYRKVYGFLYQHREQFGISDRYRPKFSSYRYYGGFNETLLKSTIDDINEHEISDEKKLISPFAILDEMRCSEYQRNIRSSKVFIDESKFIKNKRHELENFTLDPLLLCSVLTIDQLKMIGNQIIRCLLINLKQQLTSNLKQTGEKSNNLNESLGKFFNYLIPLLPSVDLCHKTISNHPIQIKYMHFGSKDETITEFDVVYQSRFLLIRGYEIEKVYDLIHPTEQGIEQIAKNARRFKSMIIDSIESTESICVPNDLVSMLTELNRNIRNQNNHYLKPE